MAFGSCDGWMRLCRTVMTWIFSGQDRCYCVNLENPTSSLHDLSFKAYKALWPCNCQFCFCYPVACLAGRQTLACGSPASHLSLEVPLSWYTEHLVQPRWSASSCLLPVVLWDVGAVIPDPRREITRSVLVPVLFWTHTFRDLLGTVCLDLLVTR